MAEIISHQPNRRRRWLRMIGMSMVTVGMVVLATFFLSCDSREKHRELVLQRAILEVNPVSGKIVSTWTAEQAAADEKWSNWTRGDNVFDQLDAKSLVYPILKGSMVAGDEQRAVVVWIDEKRTDGFKIAYAIIKPGDRFTAARLLKKGTYTVVGTMGENPTRIWTATLPAEDKSRLTFDYEIGGIRHTMEGRLADDSLKFTPISRAHR